MTSDELPDIMGTWDYGGLPANVVVGRDCWFERKRSFGGFRSSQNPGLIVGDRVRIYTWAAFNVEPSGTIVIGDDAVLVGPVFMCADRITVGNRVVISYNTTIADSDFHPIDPALRKRDAIACSPSGNRSQRPPCTTRPVVIEDDVWIGISAIVLKGVTIGRGAQVGPGSVVTRDIAPGAVVSGNPASVSLEQPWQP